MALLCAAQFVVVLDATIVAVALPDIGRDLGLSGSRGWPRDCSARRPSRP